MRGIACCKEVFNGEYLCIEQVTQEKHITLSKAERTIYIAVGSEYNIGREDKSNSFFGIGFNDVFIFGVDKKVVFGRIFVSDEERDKFMIFSCFGEVSEKEVAIGIDAEIIVKDEIFKIIFFFKKMSDSFSDLPVTDIFGKGEMSGAFCKELSFIEGHQTVGSTANDNRFGFFVIGKDFIAETPEAALNLG